MNSDQRHGLLEKYTSEVIFVAMEIKERTVDAVDDHTEEIVQAIGKLGLDCSEGHTCLSKSQRTRPGHSAPSG